MRLSSDIQRFLLTPGALRALLAGFCALFIASTATAQMGPECGTLANAYGPFDYANAMHRREKLGIVEKFHFNNGVQNLVGNSAGASSLSADLDYTLRAFPNHHKALYAVIKYDSSNDPRHRQPLVVSAECYMQRAVTWRPEDGRAQLLYGMFKARKGDMEAAKAKFAEAERLLPESSEVHYNIGLILAKSGEYPEALRHAHVAYRLGYPMPGLRNILKRAGRWEDPVSPDAASSDPVAADHTPES